MMSLAYENEQFDDHATSVVASGHGMIHVSFLTSHFSCPINIINLFTEKIINDAQLNFKAKIDNIVHFFGRYLNRVK